MPIITISTYSGRTQREKDRLAEAITEDVIKIFNVDKNEVIIVFHEEPHGNWYAKGIRLSIATIVENCMLRRLKVGGMFELLNRYKV